jgi:hypothetical protein
LDLEQLSRIQPGLARIMPEIGTRAWKLYYAAKAENWVLANFQLNEIRGLMNTCIVTRPQYENDLKAYMGDFMARLKAAIDNKDFATFDTEFQAAIVEANRYHDVWNHGFIVWKLPDTPPPDLDLTPLVK